MDWMNFAWLNFDWTRFDWTAFLAGVLAGWLIEWLIDLIFWRRRRRTWVNTETRLRTDLTGAQSEISRLRTQTMRDRDLGRELEGARRDLQTRREEVTRLQTDLNSAQAVYETLSGRLAEANAERQLLMDRLSTESSTAQSQLNRMRVQLDDAAAGRQSLLSRLQDVTSENQGLLARVQEIAAENRSLLARLEETTTENQALLLRIDELDALSADLQASAARSGAVDLGTLADDLTILEGIGPKIAELLNQNGIYTFEQLAAVRPEEIRTMLRAGGSRFQTANPDSWPRQARLAGDRDWTRLDALKAQLVGGVRRGSTQPPPQEDAALRSAPIIEPDDDLTILEGIGPRIADLLNENGIRTFGQLAATSADELRDLLRSGGSRFQTANPETWPRQARLAANREWTRLDALKAQLVGGVRRGSAQPPQEDAALRSAPIVEPDDDLTILEGIGPKIADLLNENGIRTFNQLAHADVDHLRSLLRQGGPAFNVADPTSWPDQASLAAARDWDRLQALWDELNAGRPRRESASLGGEDDLS